MTLQAQSKRPDALGANGSILSGGRFNSLRDSVGAAKQVPILEVWQRLGLPEVPPSGLIRSPFRDDAHPSFQVGGSRNIAFDYATQEQFDSIALVEHVKGFSFPDAVRFVLGESVPQSSGGVAQTLHIAHRDETPTTSKQTPGKSKLWATVEEAQARLETLPLADDDPEVREFLRRDYGLNGGHQTWRVWIDSRGQKWIAYPGSDLTGNLVSVKVKSIERDARGKRSMLFLFGGGGFEIHHAGGADWVVAGGEEKAAAAVQVGCNAISGMTGEKGIPPDLAQWIAETCNERILLACDNDDPGRKANSKSADALMKAGVPVERIFSADWGDRPKGFDLNDLLKDLGPEVDLFDALVPSGLAVPETETATDPPDGNDSALVDSLTEAGAAARFVASCRDRVVYDGGAGWRVWDGTRWSLDVDGGAVRLFLEAVPPAYESEAMELDPENKRAKRLIKWATALRNKSKVDACLSLARCLGLTRQADTFDLNPWLFNCTNGTIDLMTGVLQAHRREDFLTKISPAVYDANAHDARWEQFLFDAMGGDAGMVGFLHRCAGYSLTGSTCEEKIFMVLGCGGSGKSTFLEALRTSFGDYARVTESETFLTKGGGQGGSPSPEVAALAGARFVVASEMDEGRKLAAGRVKTLTGGESVTARFLYRDAFTFIPMLKLWIGANDAPHVSDQDSGFWRRCLRIPFERPPEKPDPSLKAHLKDPSPLGVGSAVLTWAVRGCLEWQRMGLDVPETVLRATDAYRQGENPVLGFLQDVCILEVGAFCRAGDLRRGYEAWCSEMGFRPVGPKPLAERLRASGCEEGRTSADGRIWRNIRLKPAA